MLDETDLVHVALVDRGAPRLDRSRVLLRAPRRLPRADRERSARGTRRVDRVRDLRERAGLRRRRCARAVGDEDVCHVELLRRESRLQLLERVELDGHPSRARAACRIHSTPSSRSATGMRSSAEWMSVALTSAGIVRMGKKPYATVPNAARSQ